MTESIKLFKKFKINSKKWQKLVQLIKAKVSFNDQKNSEESIWIRS